MLRNYLTAALRSFYKNRGFSFLNLLGLAIGITSSLLILQYVRYEKSFDTYHSKAENIYRIQYNSYQNGEVNFECAAAVPMAGPTMKENFPEVIEQARLLPTGGVMTYQDPVMGLVSHREVNNIQVTESSIFDIFDIDIIQGNAQTCIDGGGKLAISESAAEKYFGTEEPLGKRLQLDGDLDFEVTAVFADVPSNSHIKFDFLVNQEVFQSWAGDWVWQESWGWYDHNTYVVLAEGTDVQDLQGRWDEVLYDIRHEDWEKNNYRQEFILQPLLDIHLYSNLLQESRPEEQGDGTAVYFLSIIALFILIIAWVNYINLSTAKSLERANEVGVRKVMGAHKAQLRLQFLTEAFILNLAATILSIILVVAIWPSFVSLSGRDLQFSMIYEIQFWGVAVALFVFGTLLSGFYPALVISSFKPVAVLKGKLIKSAQGALLRRGLVVFQFSISVILIAGTVIVLQQLNFMRNQDLGVNIHETLVIKGPGITDSTFSDRLESFKTETNRFTGIQSMTATSNVPGNEIFWTRGIRRISGNTDAGMTVYNVGIDHDYIPSFDLEMVAGRNFSKDFNDDESVILNQSLTEVLDFDTPDEAIGEFVRLGGDTLEVVGVVNNYHQMSLKSVSPPLVFKLSTSSSFFAFKIEPGTHQQVLEHLEGEWASFFPGNPFDYFFLDEFFNKQYDTDKRFSQAFTLFSGLAIFVACLGLFGLASFMTTQRIKEIGIRKALGSSVESIVALLSSGFVKLVLLSSVVAMPVAWYIMDQWLQSFPYHIEINVLVLVLSAILVTLIALISVSYQTVKAARINPAKTLRYE